MANYPDFLCVGAQKAATTWLYYVMRRVPGIFLPKIKEIHYFNDLYTPSADQFGHEHRARKVLNSRKFYLNKNSRSEHDRSALAQLDHIGLDQINDEWYKGIFDFAHNNDICGEICPSYMTIPTRAVRHALSINPNLRVIIIVRDPLDRAWSQMRMRMGRGFLNFDLDRILDGKIPLDDYLNYSDYKSSIRRWESMCGHNRLKLLRYEGIRENPQGVLDEILEFVGLPGAPTQGDLSKKVFLGEPMDMPAELRSKLLGLLEPQYEFLRTLFPEDVENWLGLHHSILNSSKPMDSTKPLP